MNSYALEYEDLLYYVVLFELSLSIYIFIIFAFLKFIKEHFKQMRPSFFRVFISFYLFLLFCES